MSWLGQVGSCRGPDYVLVWMRPANTEFGGYGGGLGRGGQVQVASLSCGLGFELEWACHEVLGCDQHQHQCKPPGEVRAPRGGSMVWGPLHGLFLRFARVYMLVSDADVAW